MSRRWTTYSKLALVFSAFALWTAAPASAQDPEPRRDGNGRGFFQVGVLNLDLDELNESLTGAGYPEFESGMITLGGAGYGGKGRFLIGGEGHAILGSNETTTDGSRELGLNGGYGLFRIGYMVHDRAGWEVFPVLGIGGGGMDLEIVDRSAPTFGDVLADPERSSTLSVGMFLMDVGVVANLHLLGEVDEDTGEAGGLLLGLQAGYIFSPGDPRWELDGLNSVAGGPSLGIQGLYVRASLGGWGR